MRSRAERALQQQDVWRALQFEPSAPARLWSRFQDGDPRVGGLQVIALWALQEYVTRHQLSVSDR